MKDDQCPNCEDGICTECGGEGCDECSGGGECPDCDGTGLQIEETRNRP